MNLDIYQKKAQRTSSTPCHEKIRNGCLGLIGESGEIVDVVKKYLFQSGNNPQMPVDTLIKEAGDVLWYCAETATGMNMRLQEVIEFGEVHEAEDTDLEKTAVRLSLASMAAYTAFFDMGEPNLMIRAVRDVYRGLLHLCTLVGTTMDYVAYTNIEKLKKRYPNGFELERSMHRPEYDHM